MRDANPGISSLSNRRAFLSSIVIGGALSAVAARNALSAEPKAPVLTAGQKTPVPMTALERTKRDLVIANRILAMQQVVDAYGHVSMRHPTDRGRYLLSHSLAPGLVELKDIVQFTLDGRAIDDSRPPYYERFMHGAIYEARPDVNIVIHAHAEAVIPFSITKTPLRPIANWATDIGSTVPVWEIADRFGDGTDVMVTNMDQGRDLARVLGKNKLALLRGHGFVLAEASVNKAIYAAVHLPRNARVLLEALRLGNVTYMSEAEIATRSAVDGNSSGYRRSWEYWAIQAGCRDLL